jgi:ubiquinone biosynthesis protein UbiJ
MAPPGETPAGPHQPSLKDALLCAALEGALRLALKSAPDTARALQRLAPASFAFESAVPSLALTLSLGPQEDPLFLSPGADPAAKAKATLRPGAWPRLLERGLEGAVLSGAVVVEGDRQALEALLEALLSSPPDVLSPFAALFGDAAAGAADALGRDLLGRGRHHARESAAKLRRAAEGPRGLFPAPEEVARFFDEADDLSLAVDRAAARLRRLEGGRAS